MPQLTSVVLKDTANANVSFAPRDISDGTATLVNTTGVPIGDKRLTIARSRTAQSGREKVTFKITLPVVQDVVVAGISKPTVVRQAFFEGSFTMDGTSTTLERTDLLAAVKALMADTGTTAKVVGDLEYLY